MTNHPEWLEDVVTFTPGLTTPSDEDRAIMYVAKTKERFQLEAADRDYSPRLKPGISILASQKEIVVPGFSRGE